MRARRVFVLASLAASLVLRAAFAQVSPSGVADPAVTIDDIAAGIEKHIAQQSKARSGYFRLPFKGKELNLQLVRVHLEYLADLGGGVCFACVDLVGTDGPVYDVDFFMKGSPGSMAVTEASVHKVNSQPLYLWEQTSRFELSRGRDLIVEPQPASGPINFLAYPVMEVDGTAVKVQTQFLFRRRG